MQSQLAELKGFLMSKATSIWGNLDLPRGTWACLIKNPLATRLYQFLISWSLSKENNHRVQHPNDLQK